MAVTKIRETQVSTDTQLVVTSLQFQNTTSILKLPTGTTANQPGSPAVGMIRFNTDIDRAETYVADVDGDGNAGWLEVGSGGGTVYGDNGEIRSNTNRILKSIEVPDTTTDPNSSNAFIKGPVTILSDNATPAVVDLGTGVTLTVW
ncbi:hypothetical protein [Synechococcus phage S-MbCM6]|jgi:hypothetical protein|uniref:Uncharacterized protein n=3 Tax=Namakavirus smbcm6 TaxID=2734120 RepID=V5UT06_9CAUD|nr:hypothetical protein [Synechococcus phage ACG-2014c]AHB80667.1 hypothetical protein S-MbCM25_032 [Synechococcus phage S-MbCM25]AFD02649.1 hypothetical protein [Synechococcus phage ACG-2014c]AIX14426.1 hypothetical protein Syn7803C43_31 [Synechococcus phage ACG-2014c]AIX22800.1 hypothetical protein Syn7803C98_32 [Synechococcus phage ACG-2014c]AIX38032.1 hypothetical protein Syn7803US88_31 [Synechococcus phage ACG-2014c]